MSRKQLPHLPVARESKSPSHKLLLWLKQYKNPLKCEAPDSLIQVWKNKPSASSWQCWVFRFLLLLSMGPSVLRRCCPQQALSPSKGRLVTLKADVNRAKQAACCTNSRAALTFIAPPHSLGRDRIVSIYYTRKVIQLTSILFTD